MGRFSFFTHMMAGLLEREPQRGGSAGGESIETMSAALLSGRGEVSGMRLAADILARYGDLDEAQRTAFFGYTGQMPSSFYPFALLADGRIDYGSDYADEDVRFILTDIRDRPVRLGELMTTREKGDDGRFTEWSYRCIRLDPV